MARFNLNDFYTRLKGHFDSSNGRQIEKFLEDSYKQAIDELGDREIISIGNEYASYLRLIGEIDKSFAIYSTISPKLIKLFGDKSKEYASLLLNLGDVHIVAGDYRKAVDEFNKVEEILKNFPEEKYLWASLYNNRSSAYRGTYEYRKAKSDIKNAIKLMEANDLKKAISLINLAEVYIQEGEFHRAEETIFESISIFKKDEYKNDIHCANAFATAGQIYYYLGDYQKSYAYYLSALVRFKQKAEDSAITKLIEKNLDKVKKLI